MISVKLISGSLGVPVNAVDGILAEGLAALLQGDKDIERLIAPRRDQVSALLERYIAEIERCNPAYSLVGTSDHRELVVRHILDSLAPLGIMYRLMENEKLIEGQKPLVAVLKIADVGSGAGLPGIPLAIALPQIKFYLIERMSRRAEFLRNTIAVLGLSNVRVKEAQLEELARDPAGTGHFALITFRALKPLEPKLLKRLLKLCAKNGVLAAYKGRMEKITEEMAALSQFPCQWESLPSPVPMLDEERHLLVIRRK